MTCIGRRQGVLAGIRSKTRPKAGFPFALFSLINGLDQVKALGDRAGLYRTFLETGPIAVGVFMSRCDAMKR
jgi:hypothetical protein